MTHNPWHITDCSRTELQRVNRRFGGYITAVAICTQNKINDWRFWSVYWLMPLMLHKSSHTVSALLLHIESKCNMWTHPVAIWVMLLTDNIMRNKNDKENYHHIARCMRQKELVFRQVFNEVSEWWHMKPKTNHSPPSSAKGQEGQGWQWGAVASL